MFIDEIEEYVNARYCELFSAPNKACSNELYRFSDAIRKLADVKAGLISSLSENRLVAYPVNDGLGAICISAVENHVTPVLIEHGFDTSIYLRRYDFKSADEENVPRIHCYNTLQIGEVELVVDIDADPFAKKNTGVLVAPMRMSPKIYQQGQMLHRRTIDSDGNVASFCFWNVELDGAKEVFRGDHCRSISLLNYFEPPEESLCPIVLRSGALVLFGVSMSSIGGGPVIHRQHCVLACRRSLDHASKSIELSISEADSINIRRSENGNDLVSIMLGNGRSIKFEFALKSGIIVKNETIDFDVSPLDPPDVIRLQVNSETSLPIMLYDVDQTQ